MKICLFKPLVKYLELNNVNYAILGRTETYPNKIGSDVDIIVHPKDLNLIINVLRQLSKDEINIVQLLRHEPTSYYFVLSKIIEKHTILLQPDICTDYLRKGKFFLKAEYLLNNVNEAFDKNNKKKGFKILSPEKEFIYYFLKKTEKNTFEKIHFEHLKSQWLLSKSKCINELKAFFSPQNVKLITKAFNDNNIELICNNIYSFQNDLNKNKKFTINDAIAKLKLKIHRVSNPTGLMVAFMGADGCGKTTVINRVQTDLLPAFRRTKQYHLFPKQGKNEIMVVPAPHKQKARGSLSSVLKLCYFVILYFFGYLKNIYPRLIKSTLVIFDRYYHDILVDPIRYRHGASLFYVKLLSVFIPKPDIWILLDAPAEILQKRKKEVSYSESERQHKEYKKLFSKLNNAYVVNANQNLEDVCLDAEKIILNFMNKRTLNRIKKL